MSLILVWVDLLKKIGIECSNIIENDSKDIDSSIEEYSEENKSPKNNREEALAFLEEMENKANDEK